MIECDGQMRGRGRECATRRGERERESEGATSEQE
jgi:hypothetical protein